MSKWKPCKPQDYRHCKVEDGEGAPGYSVPLGAADIVTPLKPPCNKPSKCQNVAL